jgi:hypothetical protein
MPWSRWWLLKRADEIVYGDTSGSNQLAQCADRQFVVIGNREGCNVPRAQQDYVAPALAREHPTEPLKGTSGDLA